MSASALPTLISRLEAATAGSRELDADIYICIELDIEADRIDRDRGVVGWKPRNAPYQRAREVPRYTESVDCALRLLPEGRHWVLKTTESGCEARVCGPPGVFEIHGARASTPALALCIASLRARLSLTTGEREND